MERHHKLICRVWLSMASENDTLHFERVLDAGNTSRDVHADKGCVDSGREQGWRVHI